MKNPKIPIRDNLLGLAYDKAFPLWARSIFWLILVAFEVASIGKQLSSFSQLSGAGNEIYLVASTILNVLVALVIFSFGLQTIKRMGKANGRSFLKQIMYVLLRTFLFVLLPCMVITSVLIAWAILTNQPAFQ